MEPTLGQLVDPAKQRLSDGTDAAPIGIGMGR
jgi:hypothetical protein